MKINRKLNNRGFTIVETLIVLAIAAIIIIIVLLAVPALQRTTRNTDIKNDAGAITAAFNDFESNNGGSLPFYISPVSNGTVPTGTTSGTVFLCDKASVAGQTVNATSPAIGTNATCGGTSTSPVAQTAGSQATVQASDVIWMQQVPATNSTVKWPGYATTATMTVGTVSNVAPGNIVIEEYAVCPNTSAPVGAPALITYSANQVAVFYPDETGSGTGNVLCDQG